MLTKIEVLTKILEVYYTADYPYREKFSTSDLAEHFPSSSFTHVKMHIEQLKSQGILTKVQDEVYIVSEQYESKNRWDGAEFIEAIIYYAFKSSDRHCSVPIIFDGVCWEYLRDVNDNTVGLLFKKEED